MGLFDGVQGLDFGSILNSGLSSDGSDVDVGAALTNLVGQLQAPADPGGTIGSVGQPATQSSIVTGPLGGPSIPPVVLVAGVLVVLVVLT